MRKAANAARERGRERERKTIPGSSSDPGNGTSNPGNGLSATAGSVASCSDADCGTECAFISELGSADFNPDFDEFLVLA